MKKIELIFVLIIIGLTTNAQSVDLQKGLLGFWPFNGNAKDESGNSNNGTVNGATLTTDRNGKSNSAYYFNGNSWISYNLNLPTGNAPRSFSTWFKTKSNSGSGGMGHNTILCYGSRSQNKLNNISLYEGKVGFLAWSNDYSSERIYNDNKWHHLLVTSSGSNLRVYVDNSLVIEKATSLNTYSSILYIGRRIEEGGQFFNGEIDDIRIYNRVLNDAEIQALYNNDINDVADNSNSGNYSNDDNKAYNFMIIIDKTEVNLNIPFSREYTLIEKPDLTKYKSSVIKKQAKKGDLASLIIYGDMLYYGYDKIERDQALAVMNYKKAADLGSALAQYKLASLYRQSPSTITDAVNYYTMSGKQDFEPAIFDLAILYLNGSSVISKDYKKAKELLQKIPSNPKAKTELAKSGIGVYEIVPTSSNQKAKTELAKLYLSSDIISYNLSADLQTAKTLFHEAGRDNIYNDWIGRLNTFGKFRYALSIMPTLINGINTEIDFKNESQVKALIDQLYLHTELLGSEIVKKYTYALLNNLDVINSTISKQYEDECYQEASIYLSTQKLKEFITRFPNSSYKKNALDKIADIDNSQYNQAQKNNTTYAYEQYLELFPDGIHAPEALNKITQIKQEAKEVYEIQKENELYQKAIKDGYQACIEYINQYPNGKNIEEVMANKKIFDDRLALIEKNKNISLWRLGNRVCLLTKQPTAMLVCGVLEVWNEDKSSAKIKLQSGMWDEASKYNGEDLIADKYIWIDPKDGWHICIEGELDLLTENNTMPVTGNTSFGNNSKASGANCSWYETLTIDNSDGSLIGTLFSALTNINYEIRYTGVIEQEIGDNYKIIITGANVDLGNWASINQIKYKSYANEKVQNNVGQTRVLSKNSVKVF